MPALMQAALFSLLRGVLWLGAGYLVKKGLWSSSAAENYVGAAAIALISYGWSLWNNSKVRALFHAALDATPGTTEAALVSQIAAGTQAVAAVNNPMKPGGSL